MKELNEDSLKELKCVSLLIRKKIVETSSTAKIPHLGSCLSCVDLLVYLYWIEMSIDPLKPNDSLKKTF